MFVIAFQVGTDPIYGDLPNHRQFGFKVCALCGVAYILIGVEESGSATQSSVADSCAILLERAINASHASGHPQRLHCDSETGEAA